MNLSVHIGKLKLKNPVTVASGTFGYVDAYCDTKKLSRLGCLIPKTVTLKAQQGNRPPRICETASGMLNAIGIENEGVDSFIKNKIPFLKKIGVPLIISILGYSDREFSILTEKLQGIKGVKALEANLSCPNLKQKELVAQDPRATERVIRKIKKASRLPVIAKLSPNVTDIVSIAKAAEAAGADALSLINTYRGMAIDSKGRKPVLGNITGGLSGPAIKPLALRIVFEAAANVQIPIIAMGGITNAQDAIEFFLAGATVVAVGTANFLNPLTPLIVIDGIKKYMKKYQYRDINDLIGDLESHDRK